MSSTISVPSAADVGEFSTEAQNEAATDGNFVPRIAAQLRAVATAAKSDIEALQTGTSLPSRLGLVHSVRGVVTSNVADLSAFTVATHDGLTFVEGNRVLLVKQTTALQDGIYVVGAVAGGTAPLTRASDWAAAMVLPAASSVIVNEGTAWKNSCWIATVAGDITVATTEPAFYPKQHKGTTEAMTGGSIAVSNLWILSASASIPSLTAKVVGGTQGILSAGTLAVGAGTGSFTITSSNGADTSTVSFVIEN